LAESTLGRVAIENATERTSRSLIEEIITKSAFEGFALNNDKSLSWSLQQPVEIEGGSCKS
jgi:hypothetical protein